MNSQDTINFGSAWQKIKDFISKQVLTPSVSDTQYRRYSIVTERRYFQKVSPRSHAYYHFLDQVYKIDPDYYTLCVMTFTQEDIISANAVVREALIRHIGLNYGSAKEARIAIMAEIDARTASPRTTQISATDQWVSCTHAGREETLEVFGEDMTEKIKISMIHRDWRCVTIQFPRIAHASCFLILEIREEHVVEIATSLLGTQVDWKPREYLPRFSFTLKGAFNLVASAVFPSVVCDAVNESTERVAELAELRVGCVSMTFSWDGATIKLPMSLAKGMELQKRLFRANVA